VPHGKMNRGLTVCASLDLIYKHTNQEVPEDIRKKGILLGWCIELLQAYFLVADDLMDKSETRRGNPCWYLQKRPMDDARETDLIGTIAVNDSFLLRSAMFKLIKNHFRNESFYADLIDLFNEVTLQTELGQLLYLTSQPSSDRVEIKYFNIELYNKIVKYKTAFYSFYLPVALAMVLTGLYHEEDTVKSAKKILLEMGEYFQVQDDFLDCYGAPEVIGKIGRDIEENKCGWLIVQAMKKCSPEQLASLEKHYGRDDKESVAIVKQIYKDLNIEQVFRDYEDASYSSLTKQINHFNDEKLPKTVLTELLKKIYKRQK